MRGRANAGALYEFSEEKQRVWLQRVVCNEDISALLAINKALVELSFYYCVRTTVIGC